VSDTTRPPEPGPRLTVAAFARQVFARKAAEGVRSAPGELARLLQHVPSLTVLGVAELRRAHLYAILHEVAALPLAPKTRRHVLEDLDTVVSEACAAEYLTQHPAPEWRKRWPKGRDSAGFVRPEHVFAPLEGIQLACDRRVPADRRVLHALKLLAGARHGEVAAFEWRDYQPRAPLAVLLVRDSKTGVAREVPVHPLLARILDAWRARWGAFYGRPGTQPLPFPADLVVPTRTFRPRCPSTSQHDFGRDLKRLGLRHRRGHDLRRTFITHAQECGCNRDILRHITHGRPSAILDVYSSFTWGAMCAEVLRITWPEYDDRQLMLPGFPASAQVVSPVGIEPTTNGLKVPSRSSRSDGSCSTQRRARLAGLAQVQVAINALAAGQLEACAVALEGAERALNGYRWRGDRAPAEAG